MYATVRTALYSFLWVISLIELGLSGYRVHHTHKVAGFYDPVVAELIFISVLTMLWIPFALFLQVRKSHALQRGASRGFAPLHGEMVGLWLVWIFWLVGDAVVTHKWPNSFQTGSGKQAHILNAIVAFGWIAFSLLSIIMTTLLMHYAALGFALAPSATPVEGTAVGPSYGMAPREKSVAEAPLSGPVPAAPVASAPAAPTTV